MSWRPDLVNDFPVCAVQPGNLDVGLVGEDV